MKRPRRQAAQSESVRQTPTIQDLGPEDLQAAWQLNQSEIPHVSDISFETLKRLVSESCYFRGIKVGGRLTCFLIGFDETANYESVNYQWFRKEYSGLFYIDRIVVHSDFRRNGFATALYKDAEEWASKSSGVLTAEVNLDPPNPVSLAFHEKFGFVPVGEQKTEGGTKTVVMLAKSLVPSIELASWSFIREKASSQ